MIGLTQVLGIGYGLYELADLLGLLDNTNQYKQQSQQCIANNPELNASSPEEFLNQYQQYRSNVQHHLQNTREYGKQSTPLPGGRY